MLLWFYSDNQFFPKLRYQNDPTWCCVRWCWHNQQQSSKVWRHKKFNLWNYGICQDILKEQHPTFTPKCGPSPSRYSVSNNFLIPLTEEKQKEKESSSETKLPLIIGVSCGVFVVIAVFTICLVYVFKWKRSTQFGSNNGVWSDMPADECNSRREKYELEVKYSKDKEVICVEKKGICNEGMD